MCIRDSGAGFKDAYTLRCRFDNASSAVLARYVDASQLECASPIHSLGPKAVQLSMNAQQYASSSSSSSGVAGGAVRYTYLASASVSALSPSRALAEGGTPVTVHGSGFTASSEALGYLQCRLNGTVMRAQLLSGGEAMVCSSVAGWAGYVSVEVSTNLSLIHI